MGKKISGNRPTDEARPRPLGIVEALRLLPDAALHRLCVSQKIHVDPAKRIDTATQVARAIVGGPGSRVVEQFTGSEQQLLRSIAELGGVMTVATPPAGLPSLVDKGILFTRPTLAGGLQVHLPVAMLLQLPVWEGEDPCSVRSLLATCAEAPAAAIATHYLGRAATHPIRISLEPAWRALTDPDAVREGLFELAPAERDLLGKIERLGGEVTTEELLDLEREPMRLRTATGVSQARRGIGFSLERRGFLVPVHPDRHIVPSEVLRVVGERHRRQREDERAAIRTLAGESQHEPLRASYGEEPSSLAVALAMHVRHLDIQVKPGVGTPTSLVQRLSTRFGADVERVRLLAALSRAVGLWDDGAEDAALPPGRLRVGELDAALVNAWLSGSAWNEALEEGETGRVAGTARLRSALAQLRRIVVEALRELASDRWIPLGVVEKYVLREHRIPGLRRLVSRWGKQSSQETLPIEAVVHRMLVESLHHIGCVDLASADEDASARPPGESATTQSSLVRVTALGRRALHGIEPPGTHRRVRASSFGSGNVLEVGFDARVAVVLFLSRFFDVGSVSGKVQLELTTAGVARAVSEGVDSDSLRDRLASVAVLPNAVQRMLAAASEVVGEASFVPIEGFLWVADPGVRKLLMTRRQTKSLFLDPSPPGGLLVLPGVSLQMLSRRARTLGVRIVGDAEGVEAVSEGEEGSTRQRSGTRRKVGTGKKTSRRAKAG